MLDKDLQSGKCTLTHREATKIYTLPRANYAVCYAEYMQILYTVCFLMTLIPFAPLLAIIGFILNYHAQKHSLIRH